MSSVERSSSPTARETHEPKDATADATSRYAVLPEPIRVADTISSLETEPPPDPTMGRDTERDFMLRNMGFF